MTFVAGRTVTSETATIPPAAGLAEGPHHVFVHSKDTQGLWGPLLDVPFTVDLVGPVTIASAMSPSALNGVISDPSNPGFAKVTAIVQDTQNNSQVSSRVVQAVAFFDDAAAPTATHKGMTLQATDGAFDSSVEGVYGLVPLSQVKTWATTQGDHKLYVYGQDAAGNWGSTTLATFVVDTAKPVISSLTVAPTTGSSPATMTVTANLSGAQTSDITVGEVWFGGTDPGVGRATKVTVTYTGTQATFTIPRAQLLLGSTHGQPAAAGQGRELERGRLGHRDGERRAGGHPDLRLDDVPAVRVDQEQHRRRPVDRPAADDRQRLRAGHRERHPGVPHEPDGVAGHRGGQRPARPAR